MKLTSDLSSKTKTELTALARRKKIPVTSGMLKDELIKVIKKGLRKIEAQKKSNVKIARTPKSTARKTTSAKKVKTSVKKTARKKSTLKEKKVPAKKSAKLKPQAARSPKTVPSQTRSKPVTTNLPERYADHRLEVLVRDPNWAYAYWDLNPTKVRNLLKSAGLNASKAHWLLRVYSADLPPAEDKGHYFDVDIDIQGGNYYLNLSRPGARFIVEIGVMEVSGLFRSTAQSHPIILPLDHPSETLAQESTFSEEVSTTNGPGFTEPPPSEAK
jgi:uncharacterized protein